MRDIAPPLPPMVHNRFNEVRELFTHHVVPSYGRFELALSHGAGSHVWDVSGKRYLDLGGGIAVCSLGHANPEITEALIEQSRKLVHVSNLYYQEPQGRLAQRLAGHLAPGKLFFCNSGAEANEGLYKLARRFGHEEGRFEILTAINSFHGRTLAGIAATGQDKVKKGFGPMVPGFRHIPYNDLEAARAAISPSTVAILIEGIQGEGGITPATREYLLGLRALCDEKRMLLLIDAVQCGHFRSGRFQSFQRILEGPGGGPPDSPETAAFLPDGVSMAKSIAGGFPMGAFWVRDRYADLLGPGSHATTFGGTPLGCAVALKVLDVIERDRLADNVRNNGEFFRKELQKLVEAYPHILQCVRGVGFMVGVELHDKDAIPAFANSEKASSLQFVNRLHEAGVLSVPSGTQVVRFLPPLNLARAQIEEGIEIFQRVLKSIG